MRRTDFTDAPYCITRHVARDCLVADFTARWVADRKLGCDESLVRLHLVPCPCDGEEEPTPEQEAAATVLPPHKTLAQAGVTDGSWLLAVFASAATPAASTQLAANADFDARLHAALSAMEERLGEVEARLEAVDLNPWANIASSRSSRLRKEFRSHVVEYYHGEPGAAAQCMVSGLQVTGDKGVIAAHIWPHHTYGSGLERFGLGRAFVGDPRNSLLLMKTVEKAFDLLRAGFFFDGRSFVFTVLDPALMSETVHGELKFSDLHEKPLQLPDNPEHPFPCRRLLVWHFAQALEHTLKSKWQTKADVAKFVSSVDAADKVDAWLRGVSPEAKWPGALPAGLDALRAVRKASVGSEDSEGPEARVATNE